MTISTHITRLAKAIALGCAAAAFAVPAAQAGDRIVDDWFRASNVVATAPGTDRIVDDYFRDATVSTPVSDRIVDDWFRDIKSVAKAPVTNRIVDDYFRDANKVSLPQSSSTGLDWGDFGIGAAAMLGLVLLVAGLSLGSLALRHRGGQLETE